MGLDRVWAPVIRTQPQWWALCQVSSWGVTLMSSLNLEITMSLSSFFCLFPQILRQQKSHIINLGPLLESSIQVLIRHDVPASLMDSFFVDVEPEL